MEEHDQTYEKPAVRDYGDLVEMAASQGFTDEDDRDRASHDSPPFFP